MRALQRAGEIKLVRRDRPLALCALLGAVVLLLGSWSWGGPADDDGDAVAVTIVETSATGELKLLSPSADALATERGEESMSCWVGNVSWPDDRPSPPPRLAALCRRNR